MGESLPSIKNAVGKLSGPFYGNQDKSLQEDLPVSWGCCPGMFFLRLFPLQAAIMFHSHVSPVQSVTLLGEAVLVILWAAGGLGVALRGERGVGIPAEFS